MAELQKYLTAWKVYCPHTPLQVYFSYSQLKAKDAIFLSEIPKKKSKKAEMEKHFSLLDLDEQKVMQQQISATLITHVLRTT